MQATAAGFPRIHAGRGVGRSARLASVIRATGATLLAFGLAACQTAQFAPPSEAARAAMSEATVEASQVVAPTDPESPIADSGDAAAEGAGQGALGSLVLGFTGCMPVAPVSPIICAGTLALGIVAAPFAAIGGAIVGASRAHDEAEVAAADASIRKVLETADLGALLSERLLAPGMAAPGFALKPAATSAADVAPEPTAAAPTPELRLTITQIGFLSEGEIEPDLWLMVTVRGEVLDGTGAPPLYWRVWQYRGRDHDYFELAEKDAALLEAELDHAATKLAERIRQDLFVATAPEPKLASLGGADTVWTLDAPLLPRNAPGSGIAAAGAGAGAESAVYKPFWMNEVDRVPPPLLPAESKPAQQRSTTKPVFIGPI